MAGDKPSSLDVFVLGAARIVAPTGAIITPSAEVVFATVLYLALEGHESRRRLESLLWPGIEAKAAAHRLRQTLVKVRKLGVPLKTTSDDVSIALPLSFDHVQILGSDELLKSCDSYVILPNYSPSLSSEYRRWLDEKRDRITALICPPVLVLIAKGRTTGNWQEVETLSAALLRVSPYNEEATLSLAESLAMRGSKLESVRLLDRYLLEVGGGNANLAVPASTLRKRLVDRNQATFHKAGSSPMVGRGAMMEKLASLLASAKSRKGRTCLVWGAAGIGKSRLLFELSAFAAMQGVRAHRVQCRPGDETRPLSLFVDLAPALRSLPGAIGCSPETIKYLDKLTKSRPLEDLSASDHTESQLVYSKVEGALFDLFDAVTDEVSLLLLLEDVQFLDHASVKILTHLIHWATNHRIVFALSTRLRPDWWDEFQGDTEDLKLPPLTDPSAKELLSSIAANVDRVMDASYVNWCVRVADGNPFFLEELAKQWLETGGAHRSPESLSIVLEERISRLTNESLRLLQTSAALEDHSTFELIERVLNLEPHVLLQALEALSDAGMVLGEHGQDPNHSYLIQPRHELIASAAIGRLSEPGRAFLHRRIATVLQQEISGDDSSSLLWDTAKHWQMAGDSRRALTLGKSCGMHLLELGMPDAAAVAFEKALGFCVTPIDKVDILRAQAMSYGQANNWSALLKTERTVRSLAVQTGVEDPSAHDELELLALRALWKSETDETALERLMLCLESTEASVDHRAKAGTQALMLQDVACRQDEMPATFSIIESISDFQGVSPVALLEAQLVFHTVCGSLEKAITAGASLISIQHDGGRKVEGFRHLQNASVPYRIAGMFDKSVECLTEAVHIARAHRLPKIVVRALLMLAHLALERGNIDEAARWYEEVKRQKVASDDVYVGLDEASVRIRVAMAERTKITSFDDLQQANPRNFPLIGQARTYSYALYAALRLNDGSNLTADERLDFESAYHKSRKCIAQAFGTYVLYACLIKAGQEQKAEKLLQSYHATYRRETWQASELFTLLMGQFGIG